MRIRVTQTATGNISVYALRAPGIAVGRSSTNDVVVSDPRIARRHGWFAVEDEVVTYEHLGSRSPSRLHRRDTFASIAPRAPLRLEHGDEVLLGEHGSLLDPSRAIVRVEVHLLPRDDQSRAEDCTVDLTLTALTSQALSQITEGLDRPALALLHRFALDTLRLRDVSSVVEVFAARVLEVFPDATHLSVFLADTDDGQFEPFLAFDHKGATELRPLSRTLRRLVNDQGEAVRFHAGEMAVSTSESLQIAGIRSGLCAPLWDGERINGLVQLDRRGRLAHPFTQRDLELLTIFAHQLALTIKSIALTQQLRMSVHQLQRTRAEMEQLAFTDPLTRLPNRRLFRDRLEQAIQRFGRTGARFALMYLDLDQFKKINDTFGHQNGDLALETVGSRLLGCVRGQDTVARIGGDEFAVLLPDVEDLPGAMTVADKIRARVNELIPLASQASSRSESASIRVSVSIGLVLVESGLDADSLLRRADRALYHAKTQRDAISPPAAESGE